MALDDFSDKIEKYTSLRIGFKKTYQKNENRNRNRNRNISFHFYEMKCDVLMESLILAIEIESFNEKLNDFKFKLCRNEIF